MNKHISKLPPKWMTSWNWIFYLDHQSKTFSQNDVVHTALKILKIRNIPSICMDILFFWITHMNTQDTWWEPTNPSEWKKQSACLLLHNRALKYCALTLTTHKLTFVHFTSYSHKHAHKLSISISLSQSERAVIVRQCCAVEPWNGF